MRAPSRSRSHVTSTSTSKRSNSLPLTCNPRSVPLLRRASAPAALGSSANGRSVQTVDSGLAICLFGVSGASTKVRMYDSEFEEDRRRRVVMNEVLPDAQMWAKWEKNEAPLRKGRGWYPALDRHFLELLVISEIACLSHPLSLNPAATPGQAERIHRHAVRVRRVACERIGQERLGAYCDRVKEAFEAYVAGSQQRGGCGWGSGSGVGVDGEDEGEGEDEDDDDWEEEGRGRRLEREGSVEREKKDMRDRREEALEEEEEEAEDGKKDPLMDELMEIDLSLPLTISLPISPPSDQDQDRDQDIPDLSPSRSDSDLESMAGSVYGAPPAGFGMGNEGIRVELDDVDEMEEDGDVDMQMDQGVLEMGKKRNGGGVVGEVVKAVV